MSADPPIPIDPDFRIQLPNFEGPLDLLLYLIQKHELDVIDLPVAFVTEKYVEYLGLMQRLNLDVAAEYLLMAATLAHIKSKSLLPPDPSRDAAEEQQEEEQDPRAELIRRLLEYQKYKKVAEELGARGVAGRDVFTRGSSAVGPLGPPPLAELSVFKLLDAFRKIAESVKGEMRLEVSAERISIQERITQIVEVLRVRKKMPFEQLFEGATTTYELVVSFLALLEMAKMRMLRIYQADPDSPIHLEGRLLDAYDDGSLYEAPSPEAAGIPGESTEPTHDGILPAEGARMRSDDDGEPADGAGGRGEGAGGGAEDAGGRGEGAGAHTEDAGGIAEDAGSRAEDASGLSEDAGGRAEDASGLSEDAGGRAEDASGLSEDAGGRAEDASGLSEDAGGRAEDAIGLSEDAGARAEDAGGFADEARELPDDAGGFADDVRAFADDVRAFAREIAEADEEAPESATDATGGAWPAPAAENEVDPDAHLWPLGPEARGPEDDPGALGAGLSGEPEPPPGPAPEDPDRPAHPLPARPDATSPVVTNERDPEASFWPIGAGDADAETRRMPFGGTEAETEPASPIDALDSDVETRQDPDLGARGEPEDPR